MAWTIEIFFFILLTTVTGSILSLIWYLVGCVLERIGYSNIKHILLGSVLLFYLVPLSYIFIKLFQKLGWYRDGRIFLYTISSGILAKFFVIFWFFGVLVMLGVILHEKLVLEHQVSHIVPCNVMELQCFAEVLSAKGLSDRNLSVAHSYDIGVPMIFGGFRARVLLPVHSYSMSDLKMIFYHELTHYSNRDLIIKNLMVIVMIFHWFNPVVWLLYKKLHLWCEYACDNEVYPLFGAKEYFDMILNMVIETKNSVLLTNLVNNESEMVERVKHMKKYYKVKQYPKYVAAVLVACVLILSSTTVYAATSLGKQASIALFDATIDEVLVTSSASENKIHQERIEDVTENIVIMETESLTRSSGGFEWTIPANTMYCTSSFVPTQNTISVTISNSSGLAVDYGIVAPDGYLYYATSSAANSNCVFNKTAEGNYQVFVRNRNSTSVSISGTYIY